MSTTQPSCYLLPKRLAALVVVAVLAGCGGSSDVGSAPATSAASASAPPAAASIARTGTVITTAGSDYGVMLYDQKGQAIYLFDKEKSASAECYDRCAEAWPPVLTRGAAVAAGATRADLLGSTRRSDGREQVTYAGHPLYYYAFERPHQVLCHNVVEYGGRWLVVTPAGAAAAA
jgi:predicted lipoprotein with Yx(FWY)xxD motif